MSRSSVLTKTPVGITCHMCGDEITHDVVKVDGGSICHLRCFRRRVPEAEIGLYECPKCLTLGCTWDWAGRAWRSCTLCGGGGYLAVGAEPCGN